MLYGTEQNRNNSSLQIFEIKQRKYRNTFLKIQCIAKVLNCLYWFNLIDDLNWSETCKYIFSVPCRFSHLSKYFMFKSLFCSYQILVSFSVYVCSSLINTLMPNAPK